MIRWLIMILKSNFGGGELPPVSPPPPPPPPPMKPWLWVWYIERFLGFDDKNYWTLSHHDNQIHTMWFTYDYCRSCIPRPDKWNSPHVQRILNNLLTFVLAIMLNVCLRLSEAFVNRWDNVARATLKFCLKSELSEPAIARHVGHKELRFKSKYTRQYSYVMRLFKICIIT